MIRKVVRDVFFLGQKSAAAQPEDILVGQDLQDTLRANQDRCVGMAANMIGVRKRIIIVNMGIMNVVMYNPVILRKDTPYETEEGCLSLEGVRKTTRYQNMVDLWGSLSRSRHPRYPRGRERYSRGRNTPEVEIPQRSTTTPG